MAKASKKQANSEAGYYSYLAVSKPKRMVLAMSVITGFLLFTSAIFWNVFMGQHWLAVAIPCFLGGLLFLLVSPTEQWIYKPWQSQARRYERHFIE